MGSIASLSIRHEAIMDYLIIFPERSKKECAEYFGVSPTWLSQIIHSDAFQARLRDRQDTKFSTLVLTLKEKMEAAGHRSVEKLAEALEAADPDIAEDRKFIASATDKVLARLGYGTSRNVQPPTAPPNMQQNNFYAVDRETLAQARSLMQNKPEALVHDKQALLEEVPASEKDSLGQDVNSGAELCPQPSSDRSSSERAQVRKESA